MPFPATGRSRRWERPRTLVITTERWLWLWFAVGTRPWSTSDSWAVVKEDHKRASAVTGTEREAIERAREIAHNLGGEVRVQNRHGRFREGDREK